MKSIIELSYVDILISTSLMLLTISLSFWQNLKLEKLLFVGMLRAFFQLTLIGYVLQEVFKMDSWLLIFVMLLLMLLIATRETLMRQKKKTKGMSSNVFIALSVTSIFMLFALTEVIIRIDPWYNPHYLIPLGGMILGNAMNISSLAIDRLYTEIKANKDGIETSLSLGATPRQAIEKYVQNAIKSSIIPATNGLMTVGLVQLPGMMTGQILSGISPAVAVNYQIVTMYVWVSAATMAGVIVTLLEAKKYFNSNQQLRLELLK